jgi:GH24 family phage-related lysozyme (muramidase)
MRLLFVLFVFLLFNFSILKHISEDGLKEIKISEGFEKNCYSDIVSEATKGHGTTSFDQKIIGVKLYKGLTVTKEQAEEWLKKKQ